MARVHRVIWCDKPGKTYRHVLLVKDATAWRFIENWKASIGWPFITIILPFFRFTKCNGQITVGAGNYFLQIGW
jgi:hypothetical protein